VLNTHPFLLTNPKGKWWYPVNGFLGNTTNKELYQTQHTVTSLSFLGHCDLEKLGPIKSGKVLRSLRNQLQNYRWGMAGQAQFSQSLFHVMSKAWKPESTERFIEGQGFLMSYDLAPCCPPPSPSTGDPQEDRERDTTCSRERGGGARSRITLPQESLAPYKLSLLSDGNQTYSC